MASHQPLPDVDVVPDEDHDSDQLEEELSKISELGQTLIDAVLEYVPIEDVQKLLDEDAPLWYQDECGWSALHAAASVENPELVKSLLQRGALWNAGKTRSPACSSRICISKQNIPVDGDGNTAGDISLSLNDEGSYRAIRDAGIRSGVFFTCLTC
jgi:protein arginine N-methyltransferase 2